MSSNLSSSFDKVTLTLSKKGAPNSKDSPLDTAKTLIPSVLDKESTLNVKPSLAKYKDQILKDLVTFKDLKLEETLPETSAVDLVLILGK